MIFYNYDFAYIGQATTITTMTITTATLAR